MPPAPPDPDHTLDALIGPWQIFQLRRGHRYSTDDLVTAWRASAAAPAARRLLDLGCGIGSVGLATLYRVDPRATLVGIEAQEVSVALARRTVAHNGLCPRVEIVHADLRDPSVLAEGARFELITGSPPYIPPECGVASPYPQRAGARLELRGSVFDYCAAARRWLAPGGRFCFVMAAADPRTEAAPAAHGLRVVERWDYVFRRGRPPHIATLVCARQEDATDAPRREGRLVIRDVDGRWTRAYLAFRAEMAVAACPRAVRLART